MANENSSKPIPDRWEFGLREMRNGSKRECYFCPESRQHFFKYEDMMRYVNYAKEAKLSIYSPNFRPCKLKKRGGPINHFTGQSLEISAPNQNKGGSAELVGTSSSEAELVPGQVLSASASEAELAFSVSAFEAASVPGQGVLGQGSSNQAPTPGKPQSSKGKKKSQKKN